jgi:aerobic carbon-monoxide dehydrogenase small subunit
MSMSDITMTVNGRTVTGSVEPRTHLADFLREDLLLTGTHLGCEQGVCGACTLMVDGRPVRSCITLAVSCAQADIRTVEGYGDDPLMARIRDAFTRHHGLQCGYCTPGMLATAYDIVRRVPDADDIEIRRQLSGNLCRCTGYAGIVAAITDVLANDPPTAQVVPGPRVHRSIASTSRGQQEADTAKPASSIAATAREKLPSRDSLSGGVVLSRSLELDAPVGDVWRILKDPGKVVTCIPGARLEGPPDGETFQGVCEVSVGPMGAAFRGTAALSTDDAALTGNVVGKGQDGLSRSTLDGCLDFALTELDGKRSQISFEMLYRLNGPLAQFGRPALVAEIADRLLADIARSLAAAASGKALPAGDASQKVSGFSLLFGSLFSMIRRSFGRK